MVFTIKPGDHPTEEPSSWYKRKARLVVCGNFAAPDQADLYSETAPSEAVRAGLTMAQRRKWQVGLIDIIQAFVRTPLRPEAGDPTVVVAPPRLLERLNLVVVGELWGLIRALYGLKQAPALWSAHRDRILQELVVRDDLRLHQGHTITAWWVLKNQHGAIVAVIIIYVDDFMLLGEETTIREVAKAIQKIWGTSELVVLRPGSPIRFLGMELQLYEGDPQIYVNQRGYIEEVLRAYSVEPDARDRIPLSKEQAFFERLDTDISPTPEDIAASQRLTGELMWLAHRTRPDLSFTCSLMASITLKAPARCIAIGRKALKYLQGTKDLKMKFGNDDTNLVLFPDAAFAPSSAKSHTGWLICWSGNPITWRSGRQTVIALSTAESELQAILDGSTGMMGLEAMLVDLMVEPTVKMIKSDSTSALAIGAGTGSWRTRHLRLKAAWVQDMIAKGEIVTKHQPGVSQPADLLTKALSSQRIWALLELWGVSDGPRPTKVRSATSSWVPARILVATICCIIMLAVEAKEEEPQQSIRLDWDLAGVCAVLLMVLGGLLVYELVKWGLLVFYREFTPGASRRKLQRLQRLREATTQAIDKELARLAQERQPLQRESASSSTEMTPESPMRLATDPAGFTPELSTPRRRRTVQYPTTPSTPRTVEQTTQTHDEIERVCHDTLMLMHCEQLREGLRVQGAMVSGVKDDLATRLARLLAQQVERFNSPTLRQLKYILWLWRQRNLSGRAILTWHDVQDKQSASNTIARWQRL